MYDFDKIIDRSGTFSLKWNVEKDELPMWVADMDLQTAPEITSALIKRAEHGIFGYTDIPDEWYDSYISWWKNRHGLNMEREALLFSSGVIPIISSCIRKLTTLDENVVILTPVYNIFFNCIRNNGRNIISCPLDYKDGVYSVCFEALEKALSDPQTTLLILSNPHNPTGNIWSAECLGKIGDIALKNGVIVISDEIHCDITAPGTNYIPFASVSENCKYNSITCISPTKTFNLAGIQTAAAYVPDEKLRHKVRRCLNTDEVAEPNAFAVQAVAAAFGSGEKWLDELREYLFMNRQILEKSEPSLSGAKVVRSQATYLAWLDCSVITSDSKKLAGHIRKTTGLYLSAGTQYGKGGEAFLRMNLACPSERLRDGIGRLEKALVTYSE